MKSNLNFQNIILFSVVFSLSMLLPIDGAVSQEIEMTAGSVIARVKRANAENRKQIKNLRLKIFRQSFFDKYNEKNGHYEMKGALLVHADVYRKENGKTKIIETAKRNLHELPIEDYIPYSFDFIYDFSATEITFVNASVVGPLSENADKYYAYELDGKTEWNGAPALTINLKPLCTRTPLMQGKLYVEDSSFQLIGADVSLNDAVKIFPKPKQFRLIQRNACRDNGRPLPESMEYHYQLDIGFLGLRESGMWRTSMKVLEAEINPLLSSSVFSGPPVETPHIAFYRDSSYWNPGRYLPLSEREAAGLSFLMNLPKNRKIVYPDPDDWESEKLENDYRLGFSPMPDPRFNRVEGPFLGGIIRFNDLAAGTYLRQISLRGDYGYGFRDKRHKWMAEAEKSFFEKRFGFGGRYYDHIQHKESLLGGDLLMNSLTALGYRYDNFNYFYTRGYELFLKIKPVYPLELQAVYTDRDDRSARQNSKFGIVHFLYEYKPVYPVNEGRLRQLSFHWKYRIGNGHGIAPRNPYWIFNGFISHSSPKPLRSDFHFTKYYASARYHFPTTRRGSLDGRLYLGYATKSVPRQYVFDLYGGSLPYMLKTVPLGELEGNYMAAITVEHNFGGAWLERTGLPILKEGYIDMIPNISVGYVKTSKRTEQFVSYPVRDTPKPLIELGLGFGDIYRVARVDIACRINQRKATESFWVLTASAFLFNE